MKTFKFQILVSMLITCNLACSQDDSTKIVGLEKYKNCCGTEPKLYKVPNNSVYVPNVFTPNGDGINDRFYPTVRDTSLKVFALGFFSISTLTDTFVYYRRDFHYDEIDEISWDGKIRWNERNTEIVGEKDYPGGPFKYSFQIFFIDNDGNWATEFVDGTACLIRCGAEAAEFEEKTGCYFASQGVGGIYNSSLDKKEAACFK